MQESAEVASASKALLFFCKNMEPEAQWERAVQLMREMDHMEKASVWRVLAAPDVGGAQLSVRRTAYKRVLREVEEEGMHCHASGNGNVVSMEEDVRKADEMYELVKMLVETLTTDRTSHMSLHTSGAYGSPLGDKGVIDDLMGKIGALVDGKVGQFGQLTDGMYQALMKEIQTSCASKQDLKDLSVDIHSKLESQAAETTKTFTGGFQLMAKKEEVDEAVRVLRVDLKHVEDVADGNDIRLDMIGVKNGLQDQINALGSGMTQNHDLLIGNTKEYMVVVHEIADLCAENTNSIGILKDDKTTTDSALKSLIVSGLSEFRTKIDNEEKVRMDSDADLKALIESNQQDTSVLLNKSATENDTLKRGFDDLSQKIESQTESTNSRFLLTVESAELEESNRIIREKLNQIEGITEGLETEKNQRIEGDDLNKETIKSVKIEVQKEIESNKSLIEAQDLVIASFRTQVLEQINLAADTKFHGPESDMSDKHSKQPDSKHEPVDRYAGVPSSGYGQQPKKPAPVPTSKPASVTAAKSGPVPAALPIPVPAAKIKAQFNESPESSISISPETSAPAPPPQASDSIETAESSPHPRSDPEATPGIPRPTTMLAYLAQQFG